MNKIEQYEKNKLLLKKILLEAKEKNKELSDKKNKIHWEYQDKIRALESEKVKKEYEIEKKQEKLKKDTENKRNPINEEIKNIEIYFDLMDIYKEEKTLNELNIEDAVEVLVNNQYTQIALFISQTHKPKNKYSLYVSSSTIFHWFNFEKEIKCAPSEKELLQYWEKNSHKLRDFVLQPSRPYGHSQRLTINEIEKMYEEAKELYTQLDWKKAYLKYKKYYYIHQYSQGTQTEMYKAIIEQLKIIDTDKDQLPLLVAEIETEDGKKLLSEKLGD